MAEFSTWHVLPPGEMPTVRQVLEMGGGDWFAVRSDMPIVFSINATGEPVYRYQDGDKWWKAYSGASLAVINPKPIEAPMPTAAEVGAESRWRVLCAHKPDGDACTMRTVGGKVEVMFDDDVLWVYLASQWDAGMVAVRESRLPPRPRTSNRKVCSNRATWFNKVMMAHYCASCARRLNEYPLPDGTVLCSEVSDGL